LTGTRRYPFEIRDDFRISAAVGDAALLLSLLLSSDASKAAGIDNKLSFREFILIFKEPPLCSALLRAVPRLVCRCKRVTSS